MIIISKRLDYSKLTRIPPGYFLIMCRLYEKSILIAPLFTQAVFIWFATLENMLLLPAKETSSLHLVLPIWLAGPISTSTNIFYIILSEFHEGLACPVWWKDISSLSDFVKTYLQATLHFICTGF